MAQFSPYPFGALVRRMFRELDQKQAVFDLPARKFFLGDPRRDFTVAFHGRAASTPYGPAAGPQTQLAQNIVLSWLGGGRIIELKTVQIKDELVIPRPCIDMQTVGFNIEWSQELKLEQSLEEYVKGAMLVEMLVASGKLPLVPGFDRTIYDMSVGYDQGGIRSERVRAFMRGMMDARAVVDRLRGEIPGEFRQYRDLDYRTRLSDTLTLSTFHGCPPDEIERIIDFLLREVGLNCVIKLNPMLLGKSQAGRLLGETLGYGDLRVPDTAFDRDTTFEQAVGFVERLGRTASGLGLGLGVKLTNTLIVENHRDFFPKSEREMYLSGPPLHVLAMHLVRRFRRQFGDRYPVSFAAGIERANFPDAVALGLVPITVCSDLLKPGGYARARGYFQELAARMDAAGAARVGDFIIRAYGLGAAALGRLGLAPGGESRRGCEEALASGADLRQAAGEELYARWVSEAKLLNTEVYVERATADPRYTQARNTRPPRKIGSHLKLFDCISCDKCVPVCPNDANFTFVLPRTEFAVIKLRREAGEWRRREEGSLAISESHQIGNFADFCNDCGNCDVFCPEDGGPYLVKPRFFGTGEGWRGAVTLDGFYLEPRGDGAAVLGRFAGAEYEMEVASGRVTYSGGGFRVTFEEEDPGGTVAGEAASEVDLTYFHIMNWLRKALLAPSEVNYLTALR